MSAAPRFAAPRSAAEGARFSTAKTSMRAMELITGTVRQENSVRAIVFGISLLGGFQGVLVGGRGLDKKDREQGNEGTRERGNEGARERGSKGTRGEPASRCALDCFRQARIMPRQIGEHWPTPKEQMLFPLILSGQRPVARFPVRISVSSRPLRLSSFPPTVRAQGPTPKTADFGPWSRRTQPSAYTLTCSPKIGYGQHARSGRPRRFRHANSDCPDQRHSP
jgi:hypothetical protein